MVKSRVLFCNSSLGGCAWRYWAPFYDAILPIDHVSLTLDGVTSFLRVINERNTCKHLRYRQTFSGISSVQWRKVGRIWRIQLLFHRFLYVRIEIDQLLCVNCWVIIHCLSVSCMQINHSRFALEIWSPLKLTPKQWTITQQFTARADLCLKGDRLHFQNLELWRKFCTRTSRVSRNWAYIKLGTLWHKEPFPF